jgi:glycyl-tRNA synthetase
MADKKSNQLTIDEMATFCKRKGFVYPNSEIYGGMAGFFDYGPLGSEVKNNLKQNWWKVHVQSRDDVVGIDGSIITHPTVWVASGHVGSFADLMLTCTKCKEKIRADTYLEEQLDIAADGMKAPEINEKVKENDLKCPKCKSEFEEVEDFNLMFQTNVGPKKGDDSVAYLRPETAQLMFADFKLVQENARLKLPFGIAQMGRAFRNEISPRAFLFRCREFEQMEIEYFIHPDNLNECPYIDEWMDFELLIYDACMQSDGKDMKKMTVKEALVSGTIKTQWHAYWLAHETNWFVGLGAKKENFRIRQHVDSEKSHYALDTWDLEYKFPFGWKELQGMANRTDFDLQQHIKHSKQDLSIFDEESKTKIVPYVVAEPSQGVDRAFLVFLFDAYEDDEERGNIVLKLHPILSAYKVAVLPLTNKLKDEAMKIHDELKQEFTCFFDKSGSIGRRYARMDEIGTPWCITVDFDTAEDKSVTMRDRDSTKQIRVKVDKLQETIWKLVTGRIKFEDAGKAIVKKEA